MGTLANSEDPDEIQQPSGTETNHILENSTCDPLKNTMGSPILFVSICMGKSFRIQRVKLQPSLKISLCL